MNNIIKIHAESLDTQTFISSVFSNPRTKQDQYEKITCQPILIKDEVCVQFTAYKDNKAYHTNTPLNEVGDYIESQCMNFKQCQIYTATKDYQALVNKKGKALIKQFAPTKKLQTVTHNRQKNYVLGDEKSHEFLINLGIMSADGQIKPSKYDKYKQINKYLETIEAVMNQLDQDFLRIIDFGCGKSYLTFAMYHYLTHILGKRVEIVGLDLKEDVIAYCNDLAHKLGYEDLKFQVGDIGQYTTNQTIDMVVSLHACNTATDAALAKAIGWDAKVILAVPCCHHECYTQIQNPMLQSILKHGILKEKIASFVTDGLRGQLLEASGYKVTIMEFIDMQHTPKNILIRAIRTDEGFNAEAYAVYKETAKALHLDLTLNKLLNYK